MVVGAFINRKSDDVSASCFSVCFGRFLTHPSKLLLVRILIKKCLSKHDGTQGSFSLPVMALPAPATQHIYTKGTKPHVKALHPR